MGVRFGRRLLPVDTITRWATILPELWQFLYTIDPSLLQGMPQPKYRLPRGYWSSDHPFVPLRHVRSAETKVAPPRTVFNSDSKASSSAAPPRVDRSRSAAPKATPGSSSTASASTSGAPWRPTLDRAWAHPNCVDTSFPGRSQSFQSQGGQVDVKRGMSPSRSLSQQGRRLSRPQPLARAPRIRLVSLSHLVHPPVLSPRVKGSTQVKAGATFVEVPKPSLPLRLPPPPKGPAPSPPTEADSQDMSSVHGPMRASTISSVR